MLSLRYLHSTRSANVHGPLRHVGDELKDQVFQRVYSLRVRVRVVAVSEKLIHIKCLKEIKTESHNFLSYWGGLRYCGYLWASWLEEHLQDAQLQHESLFGEQWHFGLSKISGVGFYLRYDVVTKIHDKYFLVQ